MSNTLATMAQSMTNKIVSKNNASRLFDMSLGRVQNSISIKEEIDAYENDFKKVRGKIEDFKEAERRKEEELKE